MMLLAIATLPLLLVPQSANQTPASSEMLWNGAPGAFASPRLEFEGAPVVGHPFRLRLSGAVPFAPAYAVLTSIASPLPITTPMLPTVGIHLLPIDAHGVSRPIVDLPVVLPRLAGFAFTAQGLVADPGGPIGFAFTAPQRITFGLGSDDVFFGRATEIGFASAGLARFDYDRDGFLDLVTANTGSDQLTVLRAGPNGTFTVHAHLPMGDMPSTIVVEDVDADGEPDLLVGHRASGSGVRVYVSTGAESFAAPVETAFATGVSRFWVRDVDGDGLVDLFVSEVFDKPLQVFLGVGDGSFTTAPIIFTGLGNTERVEFADFDGDDIVDIATLNKFIFTATAASVHLGHGDGTFTSSWSSVVPNSPHLLVEDFDESGTLDLLVTTSPGRNLTFPGSGDGTFGTAIESTPNVSYSFGEGQVADLDADGHLDIVFSGGQTPVRFGSGDGTFGDPTLHSIRTDAGFVLDDLDRDGVLDIATVHASSSTLVVHRGDDSNTFETDVFDVGADELSAIASGDFDRNGVDDILAATKFADTVYLLLTDPTGELIEAGTTSLEDGDATSLDVGDFDGDGKLDFVVDDGAAAAIHLGDGAGGFPVRFEHRMGAAVSWVRAGDLDGDGLSDVLLRTSNAPKLTLLLSDGAGGFKQHELSTATNLGRPEIADLDGDGVLDIIAPRFGVAEIVVHLGLGNGRFAPLTAFATSGNSNSQYLAVGDIDADGDPDVVVDNGSVVSVSVLLGNGDGSLSPSVALSLGVGDTAQTTARPIILDATGDGIADLVTAVSIKNVIVVHEGGPGGVISVTPTRYTFHGGVQGITFGQFDGDLVPDVALAVRNKDVEIHRNRLLDRP